MRKIDTLVVHCSDSHWGDRAVIDGWHRAQGWKGIGYHYVILNGFTGSNAVYKPNLDGKVEKGRPDDETGAHVRGHNQTSLGICLIGGKDKDGKEDREYMTTDQRIALYTLLAALEREHPGCVIRGHYEFPGVAKTCPLLDMDKLRKDFEAWKNLRA